jgi:hypothetical protein
MMHNHLGYDLDTDAMNPDWDADGGSTLRIIDTNPETMDIFVVFENHAMVS